MSAAGALCAAAALLAPQALVPVPPQEDARESLSLRGEKRVAGRFVSVHDPEHLWIREPGTREPRRVPRADVVRVGTLLRERIARWLDARDPAATLAEDWALVAAAREQGLPALARLQAYHVLARDPSFAPAHELLGHRQRRGEWLWSLDTTGEELARGRRPELVPAPEFHARLTEWEERLVLASENYRLETNASLRQGVDLLFDLERTYCVWMGLFGARLRASEMPWDPEHRMVVCAFRAPDQGYTQHLTGERDPYYGAATATVVAGSPNVVFTWYADPADRRPAQVLDLAVQQLVYTTLVLGKKLSAPPATELERWAHWAELGLGWWLGEQMRGPAGYARFRALPLRPAAEAARLALLLPAGSPLRMGRERLTNLVGLPFREFYRSGGAGQIHRECARTFVAWLMTHDPAVPGARGEATGRRGREGFLCYLAEVYGAPKAHSSSALDDCLGGPVEGLEERWEAWLTALAR